MLFSTLLTTTLLSLSYVEASTRSSQFYISQSSTSSSSPSSQSSWQEVNKLSGKEFNSILGHLLDVSYFDSFESQVDNELVKEVLNNDENSGNQKILILIESDYVNQVIPTQFATKETLKFQLPNYQFNSYLSLISLQLNRLISTLSLSDSQIHGLDSFTKEIKEMIGWRNWVGEELGESIGWKDVEITQIKETSPKAKLLSDLDFLDESANVLVSELQELSDLVDSLKSNVDNGLQSGKKVVAIHIRGLKSILKTHSHTSSTYKAASELLQKYLTATISSLSSEEKSTLLLITLPSTPYSPSLFSIKKKQPWLHPFIHQSSTPQPQFHHSTSSLLSKRAPKSPAKPARIPVPIIPSSSTCFSSAKEVNEATNSCNGGNGIAVKGVSALMTKSREECWVCHCGFTMIDGKKISWGGEGCEKIDLSSDFTLLFFTSLGLLITLLASVMLLSAIGSIELPSTLAAVNGSGVGGKKA